MKKLYLSLIGFISIFAFLSFNDDVHASDTLKVPYEISNSNELKPITTYFESPNNTNDCNVYRSSTTSIKTGACNQYLTIITDNVLYLDLFNVNKSEVKLKKGLSIEDAFPLKFKNETNPNDSFNIHLGGNNRVYYFKFNAKDSINYLFTINKSYTNSFKIINKYDEVLAEYNSSSISNELIFTPNSSEEYYILLNPKASGSTNYLNVTISELTNANEFKHKEYMHSTDKIIFKSKLIKNKTYQFKSSNHSKVYFSNGYINIPYNNYANNFNETVDYGYIHVNNDTTITFNIETNQNQFLYSNKTNIELLDGSSFENAFYSHYGTREKGVFYKQFMTNNEDDIFIRVYLREGSKYMSVTDEVFNFSIYNSNKDLVHNENYSSLSKNDTSRYTIYEASETGWHYIKTTSNHNGNIKIKFGQLYDDNYLASNPFKLQYNNTTNNNTLYQPYYHDYYFYDINNKEILTFKADSPIHASLINFVTESNIVRTNGNHKEGKLCGNYYSTITPTLPICDKVIEKDYVILKLQGAINTNVALEYMSLNQGYESIEKLKNKPYYGNYSNEFIQEEISTADPVNTINGSFYTSYKFLKFDTLDGFGLTLNYDSIRGDLSNFGYQWESNFDSKLSFNNDNTIDIHFNNTQIHKFKDINNDGIYEPINNSLPFSKLYIENNNYYLVLKDNKKYEYNNNGILKKTFNSQGRYLEYIYENINGKSQLAAVTENLTGNQIKFEYNENDLVSRVFDNHNREVTFLYNDMNQLISFTNENNYTSKFEYNDKNQIVSIIDNNEFVKNIYDLNGRIKKQYDANDKLTTFEYKEDINEDKDFQTIVTDRNGNQEIFTYNQDYQLISKIDKNGNEKKYIHSNGFLIEEVNALNNSIKYEYDNLGNLISLTDFKGNQIRYEYDTNRNLIKTIQPNNLIIKNEYSSTNKLIKSIDETNNLKTEYFYNEIDLPIKIINSKGLVTEYIYDNKYQVQSIKTNNEITYMEYDIFGRNTKMILPEGNFILKRYDSIGNLIEQENSLGDKVKYEYNFNNKISKVIDANGVEEIYKYDGNLNLTSITKSNATISYIYDNEENLIQEIDAKGNITKYQYDNVGNLIKETDSNNTDTFFEYDKINRLIKMSRLNRFELYEYDANDNLIKKTNSLNNSTLYEYNNLDLLISETNALNYKTTYTYDNKGNLIKRTDANNNSISYEYDNANNLVKLIDAKGNITENIYDTNNRLIQTINSLGQSSFYSYDKNGNLIQTLDNLSRPLFTYEYDVVGRMINTTNGLNNSSHIEYDKNGNVTKIFDNKNNLLTQTVYDEFNRPVQYKDINGNIELINYDLNGNIISQIDGLNRSQLFSYDVMDNLISVTDRNNIESEQVFNDLQDLVGYQDPNENTTNIEYDNLGRITKELNASGGYSTYEYDAVNNLIKSTNAKGQITTYKYDAVGNLIELKDDVSTIKYTYDKNYNVIKIEETDKNPIIQTYDSLNRLISVIDSNGKEIKYEYDEVGNLATLIYPDNKEVHYTYDVLGNLLTVTDWNNRLTTYTYDENNQLLTTNKPDGSIEIREYNNKAQLSRLVNKDANGIVISDNQFVYDAVGNVIVEGDENYQYDNLDRLTESNNAQYSYDNAGNIISALTNHNNISNNTQMSYGSDNRISTFNDMLLTMDIEGNLLTIPKNNELMSANYDARNRLISLENDSYYYDALNNRIAITENGIKTNFVTNYNSSLSQVLMEYDEDGNSIAYYVYGIGLISKEFINGDNYIYHYDKRGSTIALTLDGIVTDDYEYDNYGELLSSNGDTVNRFKYNGKYGVQTDDTGLYYMRARYYSPEMKRFINRDVIQGNITESQTFNRFAYVNGNPVSYIDPFGLSREETEKGFKKYLINYIEFGIASNKKIVPFYDATPHETIISLLKGNYDEINYIDTLLTVMPMPQARIAKIAKTTKKTKKTNISRKSKIEGCNCFVAGTLVLTSNGYTPIEDIQIGDYVLAKDEMTGDIAYKPVEATIENEKEIIYTIVINNEEIKVSDSHPFWVENEQTWIAAEDLYIGDILQTSNGLFLPITDIIIEEQKTKVYNLTVSDYHTYFVSETGFWVHNSNCINDSNTKKLLPTEGNVGTYKELKGPEGDNITAHHMPSNNYLKKNTDIKRDDGISMNMEQPHPGTGGRHRRTATYGGMSAGDKSYYLNLTPRDALAKDIWDARNIYKEDGLYTKEIRHSLKEVIRLNKETYPNYFGK